MTGHLEEEPPMRSLAPSRPLHAILALALALPAGPGAATLVVNSAADDSTAGNGLVTLREAIYAAEHDTATDTGETGSGPDVIVFAPALTATSDATITLGTVGDTTFGPAAFGISTDVTIAG